MNSSNLQRLHFGFFFACTIFLLGAVESVAQPVLNLQARFNHARDLYERGAYKAARAEFSNTLEDPYLAESNYFMASCAIRAEQTDGEQLMTQFVDAYPYHVYAQSAYLDMADFYFGKGRYKEALDNYNKSDGYLSPAIIFNKGYCQFHLDQNEKALETFKKLDGSFSPYQNDAAYFRGYIYHSREDFETSYTYLKEAFESERYRKPAMELFVSTLYQNGEYQEVINLVETELTPVDNGVVLNFLADSQYALEKYRSAASSYKDLFKSYGKHRNERNYFRAGYSSFKIENKDDAIEYLKRSAVADDSVGAYASYYLGVIYTEHKNWPFAITSFENTAKYPTVIREDALYHQARSQMEVPNYQRSIEILNEYMTSYKAGRFYTEVKEMLGAAYAQTNNYDLAIRHIEELDRLTPQLKETYQRVSFLKGVALFNDKKFNLASEVFQKSLIHDVDAGITQQTYYWVGEAKSLLDQHDEALFYYKSVNRVPSIEVYLKAIYGKAYAQYNLKDYVNAAQSFKQFESQYSSDLNKKYLADALLRMGDCQFALKEYQKGIDYYAKAEKAGNKNKDHIYFQIGLLNRYLDKDAMAKQYFNRLIKELPESQKADHAYFQIAQIDFEEGKSKQSMEAYRMFIIKYPSSSFIPFALLNQAVAFDNEGQSESSISNYKEILDRFPRHQTANSALLGLQDKNANGQFDEFDEYLRKYKQANPNSEALENIEFESARANYYSQKYELAIRALEDFVLSYPKSSLIQESQYLIADAYFRQGHLDKSLQYFRKVENDQDFSKYSKVLYRLADIESMEGNLEKSNAYYYQLAQVSRSSRNVINVHTGLMENYFKDAQYDSAIHHGNALLDNPRTGVLASAQANLIIGKSLYENDKLESALQNLLPLVSNSPDERGAEAYYYISKIYYDQAKYDRALESLFVLTNNFQNYDLWLNQAYLLMADIYIETNELFQAKATLNSLIDNSSLDEVVAVAKMKLKQIEETVDSNE
ncbi:Tetratricopeptide repeat-containing protein [Reichenbachiella faecimaris]|uniref:Tetratricopeptide repeat-containing protein n=1 Tax=Reichenbachiella faecimaris TaxID=692418 RepID=A0A1W2GQG9_REIFA|nr:tetratricopeptide repeat protein [Reichenbachiella faecimaris]SMD38925.1 Tetratricopeptide repeat-containing protein [Reichenbachiella faecimaris]